jgi:hypothetical protein
VRGPSGLRRARSAGVSVLPCAASGGVCAGCASAVIGPGSVPRLRRAWAISTERALQGLNPHGRLPGRQPSSTGGLPPSAPLTAPGAPCPLPQACACVPLTIVLLHLTSDTPLLWYYVVQVRY